MNARAYEYAMTNEQLVAVTTWPTLIEKKPEQGQRCEFHLLHAKYHDHGFGVYAASNAFVTDIGVFLGNPANIYWKLAP